MRNFQLTALKKQLMVFPEKTVGEHLQLWLISQGRIIKRPIKCPYFGKLNEEGGDNFNLTQHSSVIYFVEEQRAFQSRWLLENIFLILGYIVYSILGNAEPNRVSVTKKPNLQLKLERRMRQEILSSGPFSVFILLFWENFEWANENLNYSDWENKPKKEGKGSR